MSFFAKIITFFKSKKSDLNPSKKVVVPKRSDDISRSSDKNIPKSNISCFTEASLCRTSYGMGKLKEGNKKRFLIFDQRMDVRYIPFIESDLIEAAYVIDPNRYDMDGEKNRFVYEILDSLQFFMLSDEQKSEIRSDLEKRGIPCRFPEEINNYDKIMGVLIDSKLLARNQDGGWFDKERFLSQIAEIKGSNRYKELQLIRLKDGKRFILVINQIIPNVIEYSPSFMNIYEPGAVKISFNDGYAFIAPFGRHN